MLLDVNRKKPERDAQPDRTPGLRQLHNIDGPHECLNRIPERIDDEIHEEFKNLALE